MFGWGWCWAARRIPDESATKPDDWDEDAPMEIEDMEAEMPAGWLTNEPDLVDDPSAEMPEDWDEEEDGEWEAPKIGKAWAACGGVFE